MSVSLDHAADVIRRIADSAAQLSTVAEPLGLPPLGELEWHRTLAGKLAPQLTTSPFLVVAVVGGTNIGKSLVFNHIVGESISSSSATASGTKHPVLVVPETFEQQHDLGAVFPGFALESWYDPSQALTEDETDTLFWRTSSVMPENLVVLDTPDIDSVARVNWDRADKIRRAADLLVCVLTQQKYNDAAVRQFFRKAAAEGQVVAVVFNQVDLPDDETYWPDWVGTFCDETQLAPELLYLVPKDKRAAASLSLPFHPRPWPAVYGEKPEPRTLLGDLSELHFGDIKLRTLAGGLSQVATGLPDYLQLVRQRSGDLKRVEQRLAAGGTGTSDGAWPALPSDLLRTSVKRWWAGQRTGWVRNVQNVYGGLSDGIDAGVRGVRSLFGNKPVDPWQRYHEQEWAGGVLTTVEQLLAALESLQESGPSGVQARIDTMLRGADRATLLDELKQAHDDCDLQSELEAVVDVEMSRFKTEQAAAHEILRKLDTFAAAARPAVTAGLFLVGAGPLVEVGVAGTALNLAADAAGGTAATVVGEKLLGEGAGRAFSTLQDWFHGLHAKFIAARAEWLKTQLQDRLLGDLPDVLAAAADVANTPSFAELSHAANELATVVAAMEIGNGSASMGRQSHDDA